MSSGKSKKNDDIVIDEGEQSFEFTQEENEVAVQKPGPLEKRRVKPRSRAVPSEGPEHFDIE